MLPMAPFGAVKVKILQNQLAAFNTPGVKESSPSTITAAGALSAKISGLSDIKHTCKSADHSASQPQWLEYGNLIIPSATK